jgi:hypothetical protein
MLYPSTDLDQRQRFMQIVLSLTGGALQGVAPRVELPEFDVAGAAHPWNPMA